MDAALSAGVHHHWGGGSAVPVRCWAGVLRLPAPTRATHAEGGCAAEAAAAEERQRREAAAAVQVLWQLKQVADEAEELLGERGRLEAQLLGQARCGPCVVTVACLLHRDTPHTA